MTNSQALAIFCKTPDKGFVKTRLAEDIGDQKALEVYLKLLKITDEKTKTFSASRHLYLTSSVDENLDEMLASLQRHNVFNIDETHVCLQYGEDLGQRMHLAFNHLLENHQSVVLIGCDLPDLNSELLDRAFQMLQSNDLVLGPSCDGGYYLIGIKKNHPELFQQISWSTEKVLTQTIKRARQLSLKFHLLEELRDIDTLDDLISSNLN
jgi:rSAM/selenodomain-associated transferase 1